MLSLLPSCWKGVIAVCVLFFIQFQQAKATHAVGADLTYTCISNNTYEITLRFYRDCGGVAFPRNPSVSISADASCGFTAQTLSLTLQNARDVSQVCAGTSTTCSGGSVQGTQEARFTAQVTLPAGCESYTISYTECDRNSAITNLTNSGSFCIYVETKLNTNLAPCNSSPQFNNLPVLYSCQNQVAQFNHGFFDPDGDSLVFSLTNPRTTNNVNLAFISGLSATTPLLVQSGTTFQFDPTNGQMTFTPEANRSQVAVISVEIEEYRNGQKVGSMIRDLQMIILGTCTSQPPTSGNVSPSFGNVSGNNITLCAPTTPLSISISASDPDASDVLTATSDIGTVISGATYTVTGTNPITVQLNVPTSGLASGNYPFTVTINDGACPQPNVQIVGYSIQVSNNVPNVVLNASNTTICEGESIVFTATGAPRYNWCCGINPGTPYFATSSGTATVIGSNAAGCADTASVNITVNPAPTINISANRTAVCADEGTSVTLNATGNGNNYTWDNNITNGVSFVPAATTIYTVTTTNNNGCTNSKQIAIAVNSRPTVGATASASVVCAGQSITLDGTGASTYTWDNNVTDGVSFVPSATTTYTVIGTDGRGCVDTSEITVTVSPNAPPTPTNTANTTLVCPGRGVVLTGTLPTNGSIAWYRNNSLIVNAINSTYNAIQGGSYYNVVTNSDGCIATSSTVSLTTGVLPNDINRISGSTNACFGEVIQFRAPNTTGTTYYRWDISPASAATIAAGQGTRNVTINTTNVDFQVSVTPVNNCGPGNGHSENVDVDNSSVGCPSVAFGGNNTNICEGQSVIFSNYSTVNPVFGWVANWDFGAGASPSTATGDGPHTVTYSTTGLKTVQLRYVDPAFGTTIDDATYTDYVHVVSIANCGVVVQQVEDVDLGAVLLPNPTTGYTTLRFGQRLGDVTIEVLNIHGQVVQQQKKYAPQEVSLNLKTLPTGWYAVRLTSAQQQQTLKVLKQ